MGFGIDFGTTCSSGVGILKNNAGNLQIIKASAEGGIPIPSLVAINKHNGEVICGKAVKDQYNEFNETCYVIRSIKSILNVEHFCITGEIGSRRLSRGAGGGYSSGYAGYFWGVAAAFGNGA